MPRGKQAKRKVFAPPKAIARKLKATFGTGKVSKAAVNATKTTYTPAKAPNVSRTIYMVNPEIAENVATAPRGHKPSPKTLRKSTKGALELRARGYVKNTSTRTTKTKKLMHPTVVTKHSVKPHVAGKVSNAKKHRVYVKGTKREREIRNELYDVLGITK